MMGKLSIFLILVFWGLGSLQAEEDITLDPSEGKVVLTLESAINRALKSNRQFIGALESLQKSQLNLEIAESEFDLKITPNADGGWAGGSNLKHGPKAGIGVSLYKKFTQGTRISFAPSLQKRGQHFHTDLNTTITQPLLRGFGKEFTLSGLRGAEFSLRSTIRSLYTAEIGLILKTINALYEVVRSEEFLKLYKESYDRLQGYYNAAKLKEKIGLSDALDVYRAEIESKHAEETWKAAQVRFQDSQDALRDILALSFDSELEIHIPLEYNEVALDMNDAIETALENRIEVDQSKDQVAESQRMARLAKDSLYPELNLILNFNNSGADEIFHRACFAKRQTIWSLGFTTSSDFNQIAQQAAYQQSVIGICSSERALETTRANLTVEIKKNLRQLQQTYERIQLQKQQVHMANGELRLSLLKFNHGYANNFDVIQAEKGYRSAELALFGAVIDHILGQYQLRAALGLLTDKPVLRCEL